MGGRVYELEDVSWEPRSRAQGDIYRHKPRGVGGPLGSIKRAPGGACVEVSQRQQEGHLPRGRGRKRRRSAPSRDTSASQHFNAAEGADGRPTGRQAMMAATTDMDRAALQLYFSRRPDRNREELCDEIAQEIRTRQEAVVKSGQHLKLSLAKSPIFSRTANEIRASTKAMVALHRQAVRSVVRDSLVQAQAEKRQRQQPQQQAVQRQQLGKRKKGALRITKDQVADLLRTRKPPSDLDGDAGGGGVGGERRKGFRETGTLLQQHLTSDHQGLVLHLPPVLLRYGRDITASWLQRPVDTLCLIRRSPAGRWRRPETLGGRELLSVGARKAAGEKRRLIKMMKTPSAHIKSLSAAHASAAGDASSKPQSSSTGQLGASTTLMQTLRAGSDERKERLQSFMEARMPYRPRRTMHLKMRDRAKEMLRTIKAPGPVSLDFQLRFFEAKTSSGIAGGGATIEEHIALWETICDLLYHYTYVKLWLQGVRQDPPLQVAARNDPDVVLPVKSYEFMLRSGIPTVQTTEFPLRWLDQMLAELRKAAVGNLRLLRYFTAEWAPETVEYVAKTLPSLFDHIKGQAQGA